MTKVLPREGEVTAKDLSSLERSLGTPAFLETNVGSLLASDMIVLLLNERHIWNFTAILKDLARWCYRISVGLSSKGILQPLTAGKYLVTLSVSCPKLTELVFPVIQALKSRNCILIGDEAAERILPSGVEFLSWEALPPIDLRAWRRSYLPCVLRWLKTLLAFRRHHRLSIGFVTAFLDLTAIQTQRVMKCKQMLERSTPSAIVTEFDRNNLVAPLVIAAHSQRIPTITLVHGVPSTLYLPFLADTVCCWGQLDKTFFIESGAQPERLAITGYPRMRRSMLQVIPERKRAIAGSGASRIMVFATSPIASDKKLKLARDFCQAMLSLPDVAGLLRLHPSEKVSEYEDVFTQYPGVHILSNDACTLDEAIAIADLVVVHNSGFGTDALLKGRTVVVLNTIPGAWPNAEELVTLGGCPVARNSSELSVLAGWLLADREAREAAVRGAEPYLAARCAFWGDEAAKRTADVVRSCTSTLRSAS